MPARVITIYMSFVKLFENGCNDSLRKLNHPSCLILCFHEKFDFNGTSKGTINQLSIISLKSPMSFMFLFMNGVFF